MTEEKQVSENKKLKTSDIVVCVVIVLFLVGCAYMFLSHKMT